MLKEQARIDSYYFLRSIVYVHVATVIGYKLITLLHNSTNAVP